MRAWAWGAASIDLTVVFVLGALSPGHDMAWDYISTLGQTGAPLWGWYVLGASAAAVAHLGFYHALWHHAKTTRAGIVSIGLLTGFALAHWAAAAWFPCDPGCDRITTSGHVHYSLGFAAFITYAAGTAAFSVYAGRRAWPVHTAAALVLAGSILLLAADLTSVMRGVAERTTVVALATWMVVVAHTSRTRDATIGWQEPPRMAAEEA